MSTKSKPKVEKQEDISQQLIRAIEQLEYRRQNRPQNELAGSAYSKLQFDFPLLDDAELRALQFVIRSTYQAKLSQAPFYLTNKLVTNCITAARTVPPPESNTPSDAPSTQPHQPTSQPQDPPHLQPVKSAASSDYQKLCAAIFLDHMCKLIALPEQDSWELLRNYHPDDESPAQHHADQHTPSDQSSTETTGSPPYTTTTTTATTTSTSEPAFASCLDDDDCSYEALEPYNPPPPPSPSPSFPPSTVYTWPALLSKLTHISSCLNYSIINSPPLWSDPTTFSTLFQLLRAIGVHPHATSLHPLLHTYVALFTDHLLATPDHTPNLSRLWEALGLASIVNTPRPRRKPRLPSSAPPSAATPTPTPSTQSPTCLPMEAEVAFSVVATLSTQLQSGSGRAALWREVHQHLLPLVARCLEDIAAVAGGRGGAGEGQTLASVLLLSQAVVFYVGHAPGGATPGQQLIESGVMASIASLFGRYGALAAAEPLRRAALLSAATSPASCSWMGEVPAVRSVLQGGEFQEGGCAECHGAVWQLLLGPDSSDLLVSILTPAPVGPQVPRLHKQLQLVADVVAVGRWGRSLLPPPARKLLEQITSSLRAQLQAAPAAATATSTQAPTEGGAAAANQAAAAKQLAAAPVTDISAAARAQDQGSASSSMDGSLLVRNVGNGVVEGCGVSGTGPGAVGGGEGMDDVEKEHGGREDIGRRKVQQLLPVCVKLIKQLLADVSGKVD